MQSITSLFVALLALPAAVRAIGAPGTLNSDGYQAVYLITTSPNTTWHDKAITSMNDGLDVILMGNRGLEYAGAEFGWNDETSTLAVKSYIRDGINISPQLLSYEWIPMKFQTPFNSKVQKDSDGLPTYGLGITFFETSSNVKNEPEVAGTPWDPWINATLITRNIDGKHKIGMEGANGEFVSKWWISEKALLWRVAISWAFDDGPTKGVYSPVEIYKVNAPKPGASTTAAPSLWTPVPTMKSTQVSHFVRPTFAEVAAAAQTANGADLSVTRRVARLAMGAAVAALAM